MKKIAALLIAMLPLFAMAKDDKKENTDPKYLTGAITLEDGKVTFSEEIKTPSMSDTELYNSMLKWAGERFAPEKSINSRVVYTNEEKGEIVCAGEEYIVFSSSAISLDRTRIYYYLLIETEGGVCKLNMNRIRYWYDENRDGGERYNAEEWITDEMALNKKKTKLAPICGKFRRETIDLKDNLFKSVREHLGVKMLDDTSAIKAAVIQPAKTVEPSINATASNATLKPASINMLPTNINDMATNGRITITSGEEEIDVKAESWGGFGKLFGKDVAYTLIDKSRMAVSMIMEHSSTYKISIYMPGQTKPYIVIYCKKSMSQKLSSEELKSLNPNADSNKEYTMYIGEITEIQMLQ